MTWPTGVYVATESRGIFYTANFTDPTDATQPIWTAVNGGLGVLTIFNFALDPFDRAGRQLCLTTTENTVYIRYGAGNWAPILTQAQTRTITGNVAAINCWVTADNSIAGRVWVAAYAQVGADNRLLFLRTDDDGINWTWTQTGNRWPLFGWGNLIANGTELWFSFSSGTGGPGKMGYSNDIGATWSLTVGYDSATGYAAVNPLELFKVYSPKFYDLYSVDTAMAITKLQDVLNLGDVTSSQQLWFSANGTGYQRIVKSYKIYTTLDGWATVVDPAPVAKTNAISTLLAPLSSNEDWMILGSRTPLALQTHTIFTLIGDTGIEIGKSGSDPIGGVDSIPKAGNGLTLDGIGLLVANLAPPTATITPAAANTNQVCESQTFVATLTGIIAETYLWSTDGLVSGQGTPTAVYNWSATCGHTVSVIITAAGANYTATYSPVLTLSLMQICTAIKNTLQGAMSASLLARVYNFNELPEGVNDAPSLMVYWQNVVNDALHGETDRWTFAGRRVKDMAFHVDFFANPRNNLDENNETLTEAASEIIDILEMQSLICAANAHCPPFGLCALKSFHWQGERVVFDYGGVIYYGARFIITVRTY